MHRSGKLDDLKSDSTCIAFEKKSWMNIKNIELF